MIQTFAVRGMTCQNCVRHVREALLEIPGIHAVTVDVQAGSATLESDTETSRGKVAAALEDAGYELA